MPTSKSTLLVDAAGYDAWPALAGLQDAGLLIDWFTCLLCFAFVWPGCLRFQAVSFRNHLLWPQRARAVEPHWQWGVLRCQGQKPADSKLSRLCTCDCCAQEWASARRFQELPRVLPTRLKPFGAWKPCKEVGLVRAHSWSCESAAWGAQQGVQFHWALLAFREDFWYSLQFCWAKILFKKKSIIILMIW